MSQDVQTNTNDALQNYTMASTAAEESNLEMFLLNLQKKSSSQIAASSRLAEVEKKLMNDYYAEAIKHAEELGGTEEEIAKRVADLRAELTRSTVEIAQQMEENFYRFADKQTKLRIKDEQKATIELTKDKIKHEMAVVATSKKHGTAKNAEEKKLREQYLKAGREQIATERTKRSLTIATLKEKRKDGIITGKELESQFRQISESYEAERQGHEDNIDFINEQIELLEKKKEESGAEDGGKIDEEIKSLKEAKKEEKKAAKKADKERFNGELLANTMKAGFKGMENSLSALSDAFANAMNTAVEQVGQYKSVLDARLQGTQSSYEDVAKTLKSALAVSPYVKQTEVLSKLNEAVNQGIAYNVEQRAFLATMTDKIVATFNAFDANLTRLIRLQQADTTAARMGMEAELLQFLNQTFSDNSYLTDGYDKVAEALVDANAQMTRDMSIAFEYNVQKWMGSLASLGFGTDTISTIAQGINYLGSGNVQALAGNTQLQSLLAMSASRAGLSYSELLVKGIDDSSVNTLLKSMVEYLAEIAEDNNAVVKAAYGDVFNFSQSDLRAIKNLEESDITNIYKQSMTYNKSMNQIQSQLNQIGNRLSMNEMIDNVFDNFLYSAGESLARNPVTAIMWRMLTTMEGVTGGIDIPFVNVMGFGLDPNMSIESLIKTGMFGLSAISQVGNMVSSIASGGGMDLGIWGGTEYTKRGGDFDSTVGGVQSTKSGSKTVTSAASSDTKKSALSSTEEDQEEQKKASKESMADEITIETLYNEMFENHTPIYVWDIPVLASTTTIATHAESIKSKTSAIFNLLDKMNVTSDNELEVKVTNLPKSVDYSKVLNSMLTLLQTSSSKNSNDEDDESDTIKGLKSFFENTTLKVSDEDSQKLLKEIEKNLI